MSISLRRISTVRSREFDLFSEVSWVLLAPLLLVLILSRFFIRSLPLLPVPLLKAHLLVLLHLALPLIRNFFLLLFFRRLFLFFNNSSFSSSSGLFFFRSLMIILIDKQFRLLLDNHQSAEKKPVIKRFAVSMLCVFAKIGVFSLQA